LHVVITLRACVVCVCVCVCRGTQALVGLRVVHVEQKVASVVGRDRVQNLVTKKREKKKRERDSKVIAYNLLSSFLVAVHFRLVMPPSSLEKNRT
jgi:hypothetical protein